MNCVTAYVLASTISISIFFTSSSFAETAVVSKYIGKESIQIDGQLDEWYQFHDRLKGVQFVILNDSNILSGRDAWKNETDLRAEFAFVHSDEDLFAVIRINDKDLIRTKRYLSTEDHVEIWFGMPIDNDGTFKTIGMGIFPNPEQQKVTVRDLNPGTKRATKIVKGVEAAVTGLNSFYTIEARIPLWSLAGDAPISDLRTAIYVIDNDSAQQISYETLLGTAPAVGRGVGEALPRMSESGFDKRKSTRALLWAKPSSAFERTSKRRPPNQKIKELEDRILKTVP